MKKKILILTIIILFLAGCKNKEEIEKNDYLTMKSKLLENKKYSKTDELPCDIIVNVDRVDKERVNYKISFSSPKENMHNIKAIVVHNYYTEEVFPSIGLFNKKYNLLLDNKENSNITLKGKIETREDIDNINFKFKIYIEFYDDNNNKKDIYYKTT
ncbi:MAG: hypothetical protein VZS44_02530 [Bacilli bacterium]|nr:hypothetical protein [Bacilli bacterium]